MKKYLVIYHAPVDAMSQTAEATPEERAKGMDAWMQWAKSSGEKLVEMGSPLMNGFEINTSGKTKTSTKNVSGYSVIQAEDMEDAKSVVEKNPHLNGWNAECTIEVHEFMPMEM